MLAALRMLEREDGPVIIQNFPDDDPRAQPDPAWRPPLAPALFRDRSNGALAAQLEAEITRVRGSYDRRLAQRGRTTVGLSAQPIVDIGRYIGDWLRGLAPPSPRNDFSAPLMLRFAVDDVKAFYLEAATDGASHPSSGQLGDWFWNETAAGAAILALREACLMKEDERLKLIGGNFIVPAARVPSTA